MLSKNQWILLLTGLFLLICFSQFGFAHGMSEAEKQSIIEGGNLRFMWLGATHMLSGYDHLAFVFGIIFFLSTFKDIAKYVTAFTIGHSVTLIYATFNAIQMNYFLIDAFIALSVSYIAYANLDGFRKYLKINPPNMMLMITGLGLIHGFGLSTRLQQLPLSEDHLLMNIISFNVGIELGQISALAVMLLFIAAWRKTQLFQTFSIITNYALILLGGFLFLMQMHGYEHTTNAEEFQVVKKAETQAPSVLNNEPKITQWDETITLTLPTRGEKEYKVLISENKLLEYHWQSDKGKLFYDFHGEPSGDTTGYFKTFEKDTSNQAKGSLLTTFTGTHGWYWKNNQNHPVTITVKLKGDFKRMDKIDESMPIPTEPSLEIKTHDSI